MYKPASLATFFDRNEDASLTNCDREKIHMSGHIQNIGAMLVVDLQTDRVIGASENVGSFLHADIDAILGANLGNLFPELADEAKRFKGQTDNFQEALDFSLKHDSLHHDTVAHVQDGRLILEFIPNSDPSAETVRKKLRACSKACGRIMQARDFEGAMQIATDAVSNITGFARIKIYQFQADHSGHVVAETLQGRLPSYLGLCFPAKDIPRQVREIMSIVPYRSVATVVDDPVAIRAVPEVPGALDLTWSILRSVSPMHTAYSRSMGVEATFSCSLLHKGALWGLISAHADRPQLIPFDCWSLIHEIGVALMLRFDQQLRTDTADMVLALRKVENQFAAAMRLGGDIEDVLANLVPVLREFLNTDGFAFQYGSKVHVSGRTPPPDFIRDLNKWAQQQRDMSGQFQSVALHKEWAPALDHIDTACGVLIQPIAGHRLCQLIWFRGPISQTVHWAGPADAINPASNPAMLGPRNSFDTWVQENNDKSAPWLPAQLESAREIFTEFLDIIAGQLLLRAENTSLRQFASTAAHDLRAPLRGINMALESMSDGKAQDDASRKSHARAIRSSKRLGELTDGLLELAGLDGQYPAFSLCDLNMIAQDATDLLTGQIHECSATVKIGPLPPVMGNDSMLLRLFMNLISNSLKYRDPDRACHIQVDAAPLSETEIEISFCDNGLGIPAKFAKRIFEPMQRLFSKDQIEGTGLGLTICTRIAALHGGSIGLDATQPHGARFVVRLPVTSDDRR